MTLGAASPHTVFDTVGEGVLKTRRCDGASDADLLGNLDADAVVGEENLGVAVSSTTPGHPGGFHGRYLSCFLDRRTVGPVGDSAPDALFLSHRTENPRKGWKPSIETRDWGLADV